LLKRKDGYISVTVTITSPNPHLKPQTLGFIKYEKKSGRVILANASAQLPPGVLQLRQTSKEGKSGLVGCHGEGLKLAALVMSRSNFKMTIAASNYNWRFYFQGRSQSRFCCILSPSRKTRPNVCEDASQDMARFTPRIRDVSMVIGPGRKQRAQSVSLDEFQK
jgi:hypothetical protein